jgi:hypothetical protein
VQWLRALSESDCYLRCYGDRTGTVDIVTATRRRDERPATRLKIDPELIPDEKSDARDTAQPAEAA